jgi:hypothetical protein
MFETAPLSGFTTATEAVPGLAMSDARIVAVNCETFTKLVVRALPFQFTTEPETNPVPFTVSANPCPPGTVLAGIRGWLIRGISRA